MKAEQMHPSYDSEEERMEWLLELVRRCREAWQAEQEKGEERV